jgi:hypothetical protein
MEQHIVPQYCFFVLDRAGHRRSGSIDALHEDDGEAMEHAQRLIRSRREMVEVWSDQHFLAIVSHPSVAEVPRPVMSGCD